MGFVFIHCWRVGVLFIFICLELRKRRCCVCLEVFIVIGCVSDEVLISDF